MNKNIKKFENNEFNEEMKGSWLPLVMGILALLLGTLTFNHPVGGFGFISNKLFSIFFILFGIGLLFLFVSDIWFVGPKFDKVYMKKVKDAKDKEAKFKLPYARYYPALHPFRTIVYSWGIISRKFRDKEILGDDDLKSTATKIDIFMAWASIGTLVLSFLIMLLGAVLKNV